MHEVYSCIAGEHDLRLVAIAGFICLVAAFTATALFDQACSAARHRGAWIALTGFVSGTGIWATHFIAMLAFKAHLPTSYGLNWTLSSIVLAIVITGLGWWIALGRWRFAPAAGGAVIGVGIGAMHFAGMAALVLPGNIMWDQNGVLASLAVGTGFGAAALASHGRDSRAFPWRAGILLTLAICGLHFTGMTAASIHPVDGGEVVKQAISNEALAAIVTATALVILVISFGVVLLDRRLARGLVEEARHLRTLADAAVEGLVVIDGIHVVDANLSFLKLAGYPGQDIPPCTVPSLFPDLELDALPSDPAAAPVEARLINACGPDRVVEVLRRPITWKGLELRVLAVRDVTERNEASARIAHLAYHDSLTGLPNRAVYAEQLTQALAAAGAANELVAVLSIDLAGFKAVNDVYGHPVGDELLAGVAQRLRSATKEQHLVARLGGDEFAVILSKGASAQSAALLAERIIRALDRPFRAGCKSVQIGCSIGAAIYPRDGEEPVNLVKNADIALYRAKADGPGSCCFYEATMDQAIRERRQLGIDLKGAIERRELRLSYQPIVKAEKCQVVGFEALARWDHPKLGPIGPEIFVPLAEESGFIVQLGTWVLRNAIAEAARWHLPLTVSVNVSPGQFIQGDLAAEIGEILAEHALDPARLDIEITEGLLIRNQDRALATLNKIKALGATVSMDDFGTGYSSLSYFRIFPFDRVKIDRCFIRDVIASPQARAIIHAIIALGHALEMEVVAEGVETQAQLDILREEGCDLVQGFLISKPHPIMHFDLRGLLGSVSDKSLLAA